MGVFCAQKLDDFCDFLTGGLDKREKILYICNLKRVAFWEGAAKDGEQRDLALAGVAMDGVLCGLALDGVALHGFSIDDILRWIQLKRLN
ncbi:MAG: hypothetical protein J1E84_05660 [Muribaculaceae bacterium]|nr:hypothetical protein [Muribaculaceae bacterium]